MKKIRNWFIPQILLIQFVAFHIQAQSVSVSLDSVLVWSEQEYPLSKDRALIQQAESFSLENVSRGIWPQVMMVGQATYQSDVTSLSVPVPAFVPTEISKFQYRLYGEVNQPLTDIITNRYQAKQVKAQMQAELQKHVVDVYEVKQRVQQIYFGILLLNEQLAQLQITQRDLNNTFETIKTGINNGVVLPGMEDVFQAELIQFEQKIIELKSAKKVYIEMLGAFTGREFTANTDFKKPGIVLQSDEINRPELALFRSQSDILQSQTDLLRAKTFPRFSVFLQTGLGRPALNMLDNDLALYYVGGLRLQWNLSSFYTQSKEQRVIGIQKSRMDTQQETFLFNTRLQLTQQHAELEKWQELIQTDEKQVALRTKIKQTAAVQLEHGTISSSEFITHVHAEDGARQNKLIHELQLLMVQYTQKMTSGN